MLFDAHIVDIEISAGEDKLLRCITVFNYFELLYIHNCVKLKSTLKSTKIKSDWGRGRRCPFAIFRPWPPLIAPIGSAWRPCPKFPKFSAPKILLKKALLCSLVSMAVSGWSSLISKMWRTILHYNISYFCKKIWQLSQPTKGGHF